MQFTQQGPKLVGTLSILRHASVVIAAIAISEAAVAQPSVSSGLWTLSLSLNRCVDATSAALSALGFTNIQRFETGVVGNYGDYVASVICGTAKGVIAINVAGPYGNTADDHKQSIYQKILNTR